MAATLRQRIDGCIISTLDHTCSTEGKGFQGKAKASRKTAHPSSKITLGADADGFTGEGFVLLAIL